MQRNTDVEDLVSGLQEQVARLMLGIGGLGTLVGTGFLLYYFFSFARENPPNVAQAQQLIGAFSLWGGVAAVLLAVGLSIVWWGEDILSVILILVSGGLYFSPMYLPMMVGDSVAAVASSSMAGVQQIGGMMGIVAILVTVVDVTGRIRTRLTHGSKADTLKYGKGVKEEPDRQNIFLGKCWQLPYCRKFVRDKCPIFHAKRTCWKERVGCMCEEKVIANAMSGNFTIPKDALTAAKYIPYNDKLPMQIKVERCRQCVIYNEHQRQKYKLALPATLAAMVGIWLVAREPMKNLLQSVLMTSDRFLGQATLGGKKSVTDPMHLAAFRELLVVLIMVMILAYLMKLIEYLLFKVKI
ncbi:MAG: hypothetical protein JNK63_06525 [Chthonomonas sp.]|nr:hypothetical protein [Chthonomonas sp.]